MTSSKTTPAQAPVTPQHPDERLASSLSSCFKSGHNQGLFEGHVQGWRKGLVDGAVIGLVLGCLVTVGALHLGLMAGV